MSAGAQAVVDFTHPDVVMDNLEFCVRHGIHAVVGTTGFDEERLATLRGWLEEAPGTGVLIAPNFSIGAILMMRFAAEAAPVLRVRGGGRAPPPGQGRRALRDRTTYRGARRRRPPRRRSSPVPDATSTALEGPAAPTSTGSACTRCGSADWSPTRRWSWAAWGETLTIRHDSLDRASFTPGVLTGLRAAPDPAPPGGRGGDRHRAGGGPRGGTPGGGTKGAGTPPPPPGGRWPPLATSRPGEKRPPPPPTPRHARARAPPPPPPGARAPPAARRRRARPRARQRRPGLDGDLDRLAVLDDPEGVEHPVQRDVLGDQVLHRHLAGRDVLQGPLVVLGRGAVGAVDVQLAVVHDVGVAG